MIRRYSCKKNNINVYTYAKLLSGFVKAGKDELAMKVFGEKREVGFNPNICTFNGLIKIYGDSGKSC